jgi:RNA polymerase primary sigma factor
MKVIVTIVSKLVLLCLITIEFGSTFQLNTISEYQRILQPSHESSRASSSSQSRPSFQLFGMGFNPFNRKRNSYIKWNDQSLQTFFEFVEKQPRLTAEEEKKYGKAIKMWNFVMDTRAKLQEELFPNQLSIEELAVAVGCSIETLRKVEKYAYIAEKRLVDSNLKLVLSVVSRYRQPELTNSELIAVGISGLEKSAKKYDYARGFRFATYATWYVHQAVSDHVRSFKHLQRIPTKYLVLSRRLKEFSEQYDLENNCAPTVELIARKLNTTEADVRRVLSIYQTPISTNMKVGTGMEFRDQRGHALEESLIAEALETNDSGMESDELVIQETQKTREYLESLMSLCLTETERDYIRVKFGLESGNEMMVKEVGEKFKVSWKKLQQMEMVAIAKMQAAACDPQIEKQLAAANANVDVLTSA